MTIALIVGAATGGFVTWLTDRKNRKAIGHRLRECGYEPIRNDLNKEGLWIVNRVRQVVYAKSLLPLRDRFSAARRLADQ